MSVVERFGQAVDDQQEALARQYLGSGSVQVQNVTTTAASARVETPQGQFKADVSWQDPNQLAFVCTCQAGRRGQVCAHVLATALRAEEEKWIPESGQSPSETRPRRGNRGPVWLSGTGELRSLDREEPRPAVQHRPSIPSWRKQLGRIVETTPIPPEATQEAWPADRQVIYIIDATASFESRGLIVKIAYRDMRQSGHWSKPKTRGISLPSPADLADERDRQIIALLRGGSSGPQSYYTYDPSFSVPAPMRRMLVEQICRTGRAMLRTDPDLDEMEELHWDEAGAWQFHVNAVRDDSNQQYVLSGWLVRGEERIPVTRPALLAAGGVVFMDHQAAALDDAGIFPWVSLLRSQRAIYVPFAQGDEMLGELMRLPVLPRLDLPEELRFNEVRATPVPHLRVRASRRDEVRPERLRAELAFDYAGTLVTGEHAPDRPIVHGGQRKLVIRDLPSEHAAIDRLKKLGLREVAAHSAGSREFWFGQRFLPRLVKILVNEGWQVEADGSIYRRAGPVRLRVSSGTDWFELRGDVDFGGVHVQLPQLLSALRQGQSVVRLDDGTYGVLPEDWLGKYGMIAAAGEAQPDFLQFSRSQAGLLDVLLESQADAQWDQTFERVRQELRSFQGIDPEEAPAGFVGELRPYQKDGLGWFTFLRRFGFGGCLADDMGLGKTVQVLALLEARRAAASQENNRDGGPSLVVVPKSLVFNWVAEARRFTPNLRILDHTGIERAQHGEAMKEYDLVITTYGTLRRDVDFLKDVSFDYVVLDEAQAVKNPASESAKAVRLVRGRHRLALSGTPVQNHLGDLWSLFDFLNPGMFANLAAFNSSQGVLRSPDPGTREILSRALRPFILRRTKEQVARELPPRLEQTLYCELEGEQRKLYDELRDFYRASLLDRISRDGLGKSRMHILEALLRLRQAALHPGLLDESRRSESSAKMDVLLPQLEEVIDEGHKALVFSQFTSMLAIVREQLDREKIVYEYLDGQTRDREQRVARFQDDDQCRLFLISLKAGGLGLNLTAADYVFLLDPWWNPAVEAQAIDRTHRIGQTRQVYACRLIAKDTVEEKVIALQQSKRDLADAIITADNSIIRDLGRGDLEMLLS